MLMYKSHLMALLPSLCPFTPSCASTPSSTHPVLVSERMVNNCDGVVVFLSTHSNHQGALGRHKCLEAVTRT